MFLFLWDDSGAALGVGEAGGLGDDGLMAGGFDEEDGGANLGCHAAFGELAVGEVLLGFCHGDGVQGLLIFLAEVDEDLRYVGEDVELVGTNLDSILISLLFNMLSRLVTVFLPRSKHLLISRLQSPSAVILEPQSLSLFPLFLHLFAIK